MRFRTLVLEGNKKAEVKKKKNICPYIPRVPICTVNRRKTNHLCIIEVSICAE